jgi:uncharacterized protein YjbI with pentapeptide repeats
VDEGPGDQRGEAELDELARLIAAWVSFSMRMNRRHEGLKAMADLGLTFPQIGALHILMFEGAMAVSALTDKLELSVSAVSHLVQRLVEAGLVKRAEHESDRRQKVVSLSDAGRRLVEELMKARLNEFRASVEHVKPELRKDLKAVLEKIVDDLAWKSADVACTRESHRGENLEGEDLSGQDLAGIDFTGANLEGADLSGATASGALFTAANLGGADLSGAVFVACSFKSANLEGADLSGVKLAGARLDAANLEGVDLTGADLSNASLTGANLEGADLSNARLVDADFTGANLSSTEMGGTDIQGARFEGASLPVGFRFQRKVKT